MVQQAGTVCLPSRHVTDGSVSDTPNALIADLGVNAAPGFVYSIYDDRSTGKQHIVFLCALPTDSAPGALRQGEWLDLAKISALSIKDSALKWLMNRFVRENSVGNYSIYYGDEINGSIKQFAS
ncbi:hypothetical protein [Candidatus Pantoea persica]|uniref:hypothetical protein n=1 Tax=Candidatus Pantoea persica TaxID=2518128 RepID=UPI00215DC5BB|nr:hypothetical protein [Candidatus Pantoea persica]MBA2813921.1 flavin reductase [Candidatus Pantoea persica]